MKTNKKYIIFVAIALLIVSAYSFNVVEKNYNKTVKEKIQLEQQKKLVEEGKLAENTSEENECLFVGCNGFY